MDGSSNGDTRVMEKKNWKGKGLGFGCSDDIFLKLFAFCKRKLCLELYHIKMFYSIFL